MKCWKCSAEQETPPGGKISFRATCSACYAWLHCCLNCKNYKPGLPNDCAIPGTDPISDREANNYCDEFQLNERYLHGQAPPPKKDIKDIEKRLFGD